ncbi:MAG: hypothetical protein PHE67_07600 [Campylobacterales bacterium]|nr:hypothetical protein [Campylobacterales bacterium]
MIDNDDEFPKSDGVIKQEKVKKTQQEEPIDDLDSLKKLEPMYKGSSAIKAFLNKKNKGSGKNK